MKKEKNANGQQLYISNSEKNGGIFLLFETEDKRIGLLVAFLAHHKSLLLVLVAATVGVVAISRNPHFCCTQKIQRPGLFSDEEK